MTTPAPTTIAPALGARFLPLRVLEREVTVWRKVWYVIFSGFLEPLFYLLGLGFGLGRLVGDITLEGQAVPYLTFVAAGLMASSAMNGAVLESTFNFFHKLRYQKLFDLMLLSPLEMKDVLTGQVLWAAARSTTYGAAFFAVALAFGAIDSWWAVFSIPAGLLVAMVFAAIGSYATTFVRAWHDFDLMQLFLQPMFLCSTGFFPLSVYPDWAHPIVQATPLYNGVALIRDLHTGLVGWHDVGHVIYLVILGVLFGRLTTRRMKELFHA